ncbi:MAG: helix-turn-helix domain-containing protein [Clostridia bacterium]|nr:helix-turn-helix domain-containing protein [Clostridia bacterium]
MQSESNQVPFLPMGQPGNQGYEAHHNFDETIEVTQFHCHDYFEFYLHIRGGEYMGVENRLFQLKPNQFFVLPPFSMHGLSCTREMRNYERAYLNLAPEVLRVLGCGQIDPEALFRRHTSGDVCTYQLSDGDAKTFVSCVHQIRDNSARKSDPYERYGDYALMMTLLNVVCRTMRQTAPVEGETFGSTIIQEILDYINNHYTQPIRMENLARSFGVSVSYLSHEFARFTNRSVYDYVLYRRVMLARQQILGDASLNDIAYQCGFNDYSNFLRSFTKIVGMSPSRYRKQLRQYSKKELDVHMKL